MGTRARLVLLMFLLGGTLAGVADLLTPDARGRDVPQTEFSAARAYEHLPRIARRPHPTGTVENRRVREYVADELRRLGARTEVQTETVRGVTVHNVLARIEGTGDSAAVLLAAHHDSVDEGPGASDDGVAVAALLEVVSALRAGAPVTNDVVVLFTDAEEIGLLGARVFVAEHRWATDVRVILNFEARGTSGQVFMFETVRESSWLIRTYADAVVRPVTSSIAPLAYERLPNTTDVRVFKNLNVPTLNFAFFRGHPYYHSASDTIEHVSEGSLQHVGDTALTLARAFGDEDLEKSRARRSLVYFSIGGTVVSYSFLVARLGLLLPLALFGALVVVGWKRRRLTAAGVGSGVVVILGSLVASVVVALLLLWLIRSVHGEYRKLLGESFLPRFGDLLNGHLYLLALVFTTLAVTIACLGLLRRRVGLVDMTIAGLIWWLVLAAATSAFVPEASYPFAIPVTFALAGALVRILRSDGREEGVGMAAVLGATAAPSLILLVPLLYNAYVAFTLGRVHLLMVLVALMAALFLPHIEGLAGSRRWLAPVACAVAAVAFLIAGALTDGYEPGLRDG